MFERIARSWTLVKASAAVLRQDRKLLLFPLISALATFAVLLSFALPVLGAFALGGGSGIGRHMELQMSSRALYAVAFLFYLGHYFVIFFFNAALVSAALARLNGDIPSVRESLRLAASRWVAILGYAAIAATVGVVLRAVQERVGFVGRLVAGLLGAGWTLATYLVVPVLVARKVGPLDAIRESAQILQRTWGENLTGQTGMGAAFGVLQFVVVVLGAGLVVTASHSGSAFLVMLCMLLTFGAVMFVVMVHGALSGIYAAALYRYATGGGTNQNFDPDALRLAFVAKN